MPYELKADLSYLTHSYYFIHNLWKNTLAKHKILQQLKRKKCHKGLVIEDQRSYDEGIDVDVKDKTEL